MRLRAADLVTGTGEALRLGSFLRLDFPPTRTPGPRYGYGRPAHPALARIVEEQRSNYEETVTDLYAYLPELATIRLESAGNEPEWRNGWLPGLDAAALYGFLRSRAPRRYVEIGSGSSTRFAARARGDGGLPMRITSIDPKPRAGIDALCDEVVRAGLEESDLERFAHLEAGDVVFFDGSHRTFMGSDATVFFLEVLPALAPGVLVGVHDVYLPDDYPPEATGHHYSEQYLLAAWLLAAPASVRLVLAASYVSRDRELGAVVDAFWGCLGVGGIERHGVAFWFEKQG